MTYRRDWIPESKRLEFPEGNLASMINIYEGSQYVLITTRVTSLGLHTASSKSPFLHSSWWFYWCCVEPWNTRRCVKANTAWETISEISWLWVKLANLVQSSLIFRENDNFLQYNSFLPRCSINMLLASKVTLYYDASSTTWRLWSYVWYDNRANELQY